MGNRGDIGHPRNDLPGVGIFFCTGAFLMFPTTGRRIVSGLGAAMSMGILILFFLVH
jgi:hypothetical protein